MSDEPEHLRAAGDASRAIHNADTGTFPDMYYVWHPKIQGPVTADGIDMNSISLQQYAPRPNPPTVAALERAINIPVLHWCRHLEQAIALRDILTKNHDYSKKNRFRIARIQIPAAAPGQPTGAPANANELASYMDRARWQNGDPQPGITTTQGFGGPHANTVGFARCDESWRHQENVIFVWGGRILREWIVDEDVHVPGDEEEKEET